MGKEFSTIIWMSIVGNLEIIKLKAELFFNEKMERSMRGLGRITCKMESAVMNGLMKVTMKASIKKDNDREEEG